MTAAGGLALTLIGAILTYVFRAPAYGRPAHGRAGMVRDRQW
ncbi:hypothetical protein [Streptomyces gossypii]|nr:hypothetical protein [Streptomyces gossypii]